MRQSTASIGYTGLSVSTLEGGRLRQSNTSVIYTRPVCFNTGGKLHHTTVISASAAHSPNSDEQGWETLTAYTCNYARPARKAHNMVCSTLQALHDLRHPSFLEEGAGKHCSECGSAVVRVPCTRKHGHKHWPQGPTLEENLRGSKVDRLQTSK